MILRQGGSVLDRRKKYLRHLSKQEELKAKKRDSFKKSIVPFAIGGLLLLMLMK